MISHFKIEDDRENLSNKVKHKRGSENESHSESDFYLPLQQRRVKEPFIDEP